MWAIYEKDKKDLEVYGEMCAPHKPFSVQLCINWGCNRQATVKNTTFDQDGLPHCKGACDFCGAACLADPETGAWEHKRMDVEVAAELARQMHAWKPTDEDMEHLAETNERLSNSRHPRFSLELNYHGKQYRLE